MRLGLSLLAVTALFSTELTAFQMGSEGVLSGHLLAGATAFIWTSEVKALAGFGVVGRVAIGEQI